MARWSDKREFIFKAVEEMYTGVASRPGAIFHFPTGRLACLFVGYPAGQLDCLPDEATESFAGVGYFLDLAGIQSGESILDLGSGSGTDSLLAAVAASSAGRVIGVDMTRAQLAKASRLAAAAGLAGRTSTVSSADHHGSKARHFLTARTANRSCRSWRSLTGSTSSTAKASPTSRGATRAPSAPSRPYSR